MGRKGGITVKKLREEQMICRCGSKLVKLSAKEFNEIKHKFEYGHPRGLLRCKNCNALAAINVSYSNPDKDEWYEHPDEIGLPSDSEAVDRIIGSLASVPEEPFIAEVIYFDYMFQCEGKGISCELYSLASCGLGDKIHCQDGWCPFDPYPEAYKEKFWYGTKSKWPESLGIISYWVKKIKSSKPRNALIDAVRRGGTLHAQKITNALLELFIKSKGDIELQEFVLNVLTKQGFDDSIKSLLFQCLDRESDPRLQRRAVILARNIYWPDIVKAAKEISYLAGRSGLRKEVEKTLRILRTRAEYVK